MSEEAELAQEHGEQRISAFSGRPHQVVCEIVICEPTERLAYVDSPLRRRK